MTGAGSGIGRATALRLAREGARVVAADIAADRLDQLLAEFPDLDLVPVAGDITTEAGVQAVVAAAGGRVDALANVAGIMDAFLPPAEVDDATWERVFAVNVTAVMRLTRAVLPTMLAAGRRLDRQRRLRGQPARLGVGVAYTASKHAVNGLTKSTAVLYGRRHPRQRGRPRRRSPTSRHPSSPSTPPARSARSCRPRSPGVATAERSRRPSPSCSATTA